MIAPDGTIFTATKPAPVGWYYEGTAHASELAWKALAPVAPKRVSMGSANSLCVTVLGGIDHDRGEPWVMIEPGMVGWGATDERDGNCVTSAITNGDTFNYSIELLEAKFPVRVNQYALNIPGGVGAGRYRGGEGDDPAGFRRNNLEGTLDLFDTARRAGVRRVVFLSSRAVYDGVKPGTPLSENLHLTPTTLYGEIKLKAEQALAFMSADEQGFSGTSLRVTGVYGDLRPNKWDGLFSDYLAGRDVPVRAASEVHGRDVAAACRMMLEAETSKVAGESFNVSDIVTDTHDILAPLKAATGSENALPAPGDRASVATMPTDKIRALGWEPGGEPLLAETVQRLAATLPQN